MTAKSQDPKSQAFKSQTSKSQDPKSQDPKPQASKFPDHSAQKHSAQAPLATTPEALAGTLERHVVLVAPEVHWNTGNVGRTCLGTGTTLHLVEPLGFSLEAKQVRRAGLDYWPRVQLRVWPDFRRFLSAMKPTEGEVAIFTTRGARSFWQMPRLGRMFLVFGSETQGLPEAIHRQFADSSYFIPYRPDIRCLNLSTAAAIVLYESLRPSNAS